MNRRFTLGALGAASLAGFASRALAQAAAPHDHHHGHGAMPAMPAAAGPGYKALQAATATCVADGQTCLAHCIRLLSTGDKSMADCARTVSQLLPLCSALQSLAGQGSPLTPALAKVALDGCSTCAEACKQHVNHHAECKACYESCLECIKQCKAVI
jgi:Cys-rich four helix bundle protein (predicted Tat secretion target)